MMEGIRGLSRPIGAWRACGLMISLRLRRRINQLAAGLASKKKRALEGERKATPAKKNSNWLIAIFFGGLFLFNGFMLSGTMVNALEKILGAAHVEAAAALIVTILIFDLVLMGLAMENADVSKLDSDMDWLLSLPVSAPMIFLMKAIEQTALNFFGWFTIFPLLSVLCWNAGLRWGILPAALALTLPTMFAIGMMRVTAETALRRFCPAGLMRNVQAMATAVGMVVIIPLVSVSGFANRPEFFLWRFFKWMGDAPLWSPFGSPVRVLFVLSDSSDVRVTQLAIFVGTMGGTALLCWAALKAMLAGGVSSGRGSLQGSRPSTLKPGAASKESARPNAGWRPTGFARGIIWKDLHLLIRDRNFLMSTVFVPLMLVGMQLLLNPGMIENAMKNPRHMGALAFGLGVYTLLFTAMSALAAEGPALWILYTVPHRIERLLMKKALFWSCFASVYTLAMLAYGFSVHGLNSELVLAGLFALAGVPVYALICGALGVFGSDPFETDVKRRIRPDYMYLAMFLKALYIYSFYAPSAWTGVTLLVLLSLLALALWQKVGNQMPYLLDPVAQPPAQLALSDGMIAVLIFFVLQGLLGLLAIAGMQMPMVPAIVFSFGVAGLLAFTMVWYTLWRHKVSNLRRTLGFQLGKSGLGTIATGVMCSLPAALIGAGYLWLTEHWGWLRELKLEALKASPLKFEDADKGWFIALAVVAAPLCEEAIFRGMVFRGLRQNYGAILSVLASAAVFAVVHPALSVLPVFCMGVMAAVAFERTESLLAPILVHGIYNAVVVHLNR